MKVADRVLRANFVRLLIASASSAAVASKKAKENLKQRPEQQRQREQQQQTEPSHSSRQKSEINFQIVRLGSCACKLVTNVHRVHVVSRQISCTRGAVRHRPTVVLAHSHTFCAQTYLHSCVHPFLIR